MTQFLVMTDVWDEGRRIETQETFFLEEEDFREIRQRLLNMAGLNYGR